MGALNIYPVVWAWAESGKRVRVNTIASPKQQAKKSKTIEFVTMNSSREDIEHVKFPKLIHQCFRQLSSIGSVKAGDVRGTSALQKKQSEQHLEQTLSTIKMSTPAESETKPDESLAADVTMEPAADVPKQEKEDEAVDLEKLKANFQETAKAYLIEQSRHVVIPSFSKWFDMNETHLIEKKLFPDFFPAKTSDDTPVSVYKTPETYKNMRDFMINTYRINPIEYLTVTAVRRNLAGDVASIIRVHRFLEKWGLINYQIDPRTKPSLVGPQYTGHFQVTLDTPKGLTPFIPEHIKVTRGHKAETNSHAEVNNAPAASDPSDASEELTKIPLNLEITRNIFDESKSGKSPASIAYFCNETSTDVSDVRYHNLKSRALAGGNLGPTVISKECYEQGLFPLNFASSDFVKLEKSGESGKWSQQELLLLLEGIEMFGSSEANPQSLFINSNGQWDRISEHVASKTREECLTKFLQLPIEDKYFQKLVKVETEETLDNGLDKSTIIQEVVKKLMESKEGSETIAANSKKIIEDGVLDQTNLINQVIELTLEKFETKMSSIKRLEMDLVKAENLVNLQSKQLLVERWLQYEKVSEFKKQNTNPELAPLLDSLLVPTSLQEVNKSFNRINLGESNEQLAVSATEEATEDSLPISVGRPKAYQFWSA